MITIISGILIIVYCLYSLLYLDNLISKFNSKVSDTVMNSFMFLFIVIWLIIEFFFQSGIICLIPFIPMAFKSPTKKNERLFYTILLSSVIITTSFVILNKLWFNFNFWTLKF